MDLSTRQLTTRAAVFALLLGIGMSFGLPLLGGIPEIFRSIGVILICIGVLLAVISASIAIFTRERGNRHL